MIRSAEPPATAFAAATLTAVACLGVGVPWPAAALLHALTAALAARMLWRWRHDTGRARSE